jgi:hypothetical protein
MTAGTHKFGLAMPLDPAAQSRWMALCDLLDRNGVRSMAGFGYPAHLTPLVVLSADQNAVSRAFADFAAAVGLITVSVETLGVFRAPQHVLWLGIKRCASLVALQADLFRTFAHFGISHFHRPGTWSPHITLAMDIASDQELDHARKIVQEAFEPFEASATYLELVRFPPPVVLATKSLGGAAAGTHHDQT